MNFHNKLECLSAVSFLQPNLMFADEARNLRTGSSVIKHFSAVVFDFS
jgi:hypothetical protein